MSEIRRIRISLGKFSEETTTDKFEEVSTRVVQQAGGGVPKIEYLDGPPPKAEDDSEAEHGSEEEPKAASTAATGFAPPAKGKPRKRRKDEGISIGNVDEEGRARSIEAYEALVGAGFAPAASLYERGTKVNELGVENAARSRAEFDSMPTVMEYCGDFIETIRAEERHDIQVETTALRLDAEGRLVLPNHDMVLLTEHAFPGLLKQMYMPDPADNTRTLSMSRGMAYLIDCWPELRAYNFNVWAKRVGRKEAEEIEADPELRRKLTTLRLRRNGKASLEEVYGVVSERYGDYDVDKIAEALSLAAPENARGTVTYDGYRAKFEVMMHSDVRPEKYVSGEFFKAGVKIRTDDTGGGSIRGETIVFQNLCLNLIVIDRAKQPLFSIKHIGTVQEIAAQFREGFDKIEEQLGYFMRAWGYALRENVVETAHKANKEAPLKISDAIPGLFNGILDREMVRVPGKKEVVVPKLMKYWGEDQSAAAGPSRGAIVNAFTAYAQKEPMAPWARDQIELDAGQLLYGNLDRSTGARRDPAPLPWKEFGDEVEMDA